MFCTRVAENASLKLHKSSIVYLTAVSKESPRKIKERLEKMFSNSPGSLDNPMFVRDSSKHIVFLVTLVFVVILLFAFGSFRGGVSDLFRTSYAPVETPSITFSDVKGNLEVI